MSLAISTTLLDQIRAHARAAAPQECCGLLLGTGSDVHAIVPARNVADAPLHRFEIDPIVLLRAHRAAREGGPAIIGHYHSHPGGAPFPSLVDAAMAEGQGEFWLIMGGEGAMKAWRALPSGSVHGCFEPVELNPLP
ncbi:peptidase M67 family protein [Sphingobium sp. SYK-6]|uniref:Mov34/MPN/PAD-1 family protein n=1 Tax=Sphingobium sp. (strain NBRC 103272 / SYK-6) TaxID=627192 RepID=UPI000227664F|nr:M67 family metallopeptidase [Sphingobium sp. SYK-6]BAK65078.1 peptidase M67 family protein [Sphingobium sp. SYK-6]